MPTTYATDKTPTAAQYIDLLHRANFAARRPVDDLPTIQAMLDHANLFITAWDQNQTLIGAARSVTDFAFCCYLSDLAVDQAHQNQGVGKHLIRFTNAVDLTFSNHRSPRKIHRSLLIPGTTTYLKVVVPSLNLILRNDLQNSPK